jgi:hypothetical protein
VRPLKAEMQIESFLLHRTLLAAISRNYFIIIRLLPQSKHSKSGVD